MIQIHFMKTNNDGWGNCFTQLFTLQRTVDSCFLDQTGGGGKGSCHRKRPTMLMPLFFSFFGEMGKKILCVRFTNRIQKWKDKTSVVFAWWWCREQNIIYTRTFHSAFLCDICVGFIIAESSWASSRTVWSCRQEKKKLPPPSTPLGGDMPLWARLHRHSLTQLSFIG